MECRRMLLRVGRRTIDLLLSALVHWATRSGWLRFCRLAPQVKMHGRELLPWSEERLVGFFLCVEAKRKRTLAIRELNSLHEVRCGRESGDGLWLTLSPAFRRSVQSASQPLRQIPCISGWLSCSAWRLEIFSASVTCVLTWTFSLTCVYVGFFFFYSPKVKPTRVPLFLLATSLDSSKVYLWSVGVFVWCLDLEFKVWWLNFGDFFSSPLRKSNFIIVDLVYSFFIRKFRCLLRCELQVVVIFGPCF